MQCKTCGYMMTPFETDCPRCQSVANYKVAPMPVEPVTTPSALIDSSTISCPCCQSGNVQKVVAIVKAGAWSGKSTITTVGADSAGNMMIGGGTAVSGGATHLVSQLTLPKPMPVRSTAGVLIFTVLLTFFVVMFLLIGLIAADSSSRESNLVGAVFLLPFLGMSAFFYGHTVRQNRVALDDQNLYEHLYPQWEKLWYCHKCDSVFDPESRRFAPSHKMATLF